MATLFKSTFRFRSLPFDISHPPCHVVLWPLGLDITIRENALQPNAIILHRKSSISFYLTSEFSVSLQFFFFCFHPVTTNCPLPTPSSRINGLQFNITSSGAYSCVCIGSVPADYTRRPFRSCDAVGAPALKSIYRDIHNIHARPDSSRKPKRRPASAPVTGRRLDGADRQRV